MTKYFTSEGLAKLKKELNYLKDVKRKEVATKIRYAASFGDLKENASYHQAKEDQAFLEGRILHLEKSLKQAQELTKPKQSTKIQLGSKVLLAFEGKDIKFQIVEQEEADLQQGKISLQSPLGRALLNKSAGESVKIKISENEENEIEYKILKID
ncbi:MAG: transcription elongation factor GreA [Candidatus Nealsonbacteria bacterium]|nr:transcription elongation factor GreA [Candidatus Nealsonbacteria bacterium]